MSDENEIHTQLGEIKAGVLYLVKSVDELKVDLKAHAASDESRFKPLENDRQQAIGRKAMWMLFIGLVSALSGYMGEHKP